MEGNNKKLQQIKDSTSYDDQEMFWSCTRLQKTTI